MNSSVIRAICFVFFVFGVTGTVEAEQDVFLMKFILQRSDDGRICAKPQLEIRKWNENFPPMIVLRHQVVRVTPRGTGSAVIEAVSGIGESTLPIPGVDFTIKYCFNPLKAGHHQLTSWHVLYAGKIYALFFSDGRGGVSQEVLWDADGKQLMGAFLKERTLNQI